MIVPQLLEMVVKVHCVRVCNLFMSLAPVLCYCKIKGNNYTMFHGCEEDII